MNYLFVSDFEENRHSGAAGTLIAIGEALCQLGHSVDYLWKTTQPYKFTQGSLQILLELPKRQYHQVEAQLRQKKYEVVIISQPFSFLIYESLKKKYPETLFLNRTHGWEDRVTFSAAKYGWDESAKNTMSKAWKTIRQKWLRNFCERVLSSADGLIVPQTNCASFIQKNREVASDKIAVIPYGLEESYQGNNWLKSSDSEQVKMIYVGNYLPIKGSHVMERILPRIGSQFENTMLTMIVPQSDVDRVKEIYADSFGSRLLVRSWMNREDLMELYDAHDVLLFPSLFEGYGKTLLEAMAFGLCVVGFGEGALPDITKSGEAALYCHVGDEEKLEAFLTQCAETPHLPRKMGWMAYQLAQKYTWKRNAEETHQFCLKLKGQKEKAFQATHES